MFRQNFQRVVLNKVIYYPPTKGYAVILKEETGNRQLPIVVGVFEAQAIALAVEKIKMPRPITHDLFINFLDKLNVKIEKVVVDDLTEGTFYAKIYYRLDELSDKLYQLDSRPSDAIALALRSQAEIFVAEKVMRAAGQTSDIKNVGTDEEEIIDASEEEEHATNKLVRLMELQERLQKAIDEENYEEAADIRDQINSIERNDTTVN